MADLLSDTPAAYARRICYISDASTIYARTMNEFGRSPSIERIKQMQAERAKPMRDYGEAIEPEPVKSQQPITLLPAPVTPHDMVRSIAARLGYTYDELVGPVRLKPLVRARFMVAAVLAHHMQKKTRLGVNRAVGRILGGRDHSTINNALEQWELIKVSDYMLATIYDEFTGEPQ